MNSISMRCEYSIGIKVLVAILTLISWLVLIVTLPLSLCFCLKVIQEYEKAAICKLGRLNKKLKGPGMIIVLPMIESFQRIDMRQQIVDIPRQDVITKDSVSISVDAVSYCKVFDPFISLLNVKDPMKATERLAQCILTKVFGTRELQEILSNKGGLGKEVLAVLEIATAPWGIKVERVEIEDISLPNELQRAMAAEAEAARAAKAKLIKAEGEIKSARFLQQASATLSKSPYALQLKYLQTINSMANNNESTIVFPIPVDIDISSMINKNKEV